MKFFLWYNLSLCLLSVVVRLVLLYFSQYPRNVKWTAFEDGLSIALTSLYSLWIIYLLFFLNS